MELFYLILGRLLRRQVDKEELLLDKKEVNIITEIIIYPLVQPMKMKM